MVGKNRHLQWDCHDEQGLQIFAIYCKIHSMNNNKKGDFRIRVSLLFEIGGKYKNIIAKKGRPWFHYQSLQGEERGKLNNNFK